MARRLEGFRNNPQFYGPTSTAVFTLVLSGVPPAEAAARAHRARGASETLGLDSSPAMLERARAHAGAGLAFALGDIAGFEGRGFDLVLSHAALHWVPGHPELLARLAGALAPGGQLAVQVPANHDHPSHRLAHALAAEEPFAAALSLRNSQDAP